MKKLAVFALTWLAVIAMPAAAQSLTDCKTEASQTRYAAEFECFEAWGPQSGEWSVPEHGSLDECLGALETDFSTEIEECNELY